MSLEHPLIPESQEVLKQVKAWGHIEGTQGPTWESYRYLEPLEQQYKY